LDGGSLLNIDNDFSNGGSGGAFVFDNATHGTTYRLVNFDTTTFLQTDFTALWIDPLILVNGTFDLDTTLNFLDFTFLGAVATGTILQNSDPVNIPTFADFIVSGRVTTGTPSENIIINSLIFNPGSSLQVFNNLTDTSGNFTVGSGSATILDGNILTPGNFNKNGAGTLIANTNFGIGGAANINAGALFVNGNFSVTQGLTVFQNVLLGGNGIINGNVFNNGFVAPGNSVGTLTINGNTKGPMPTTVVVAAPLSIRHCLDYTLPTRTADFMPMPSLREDTTITMFAARLTFQQSIAPHEALRMGGSLARH